MKLVTKYFLKKMHNKAFINTIELPVMLGITSDPKILKKERKKQELAFIDKRLFQGHVLSFHPSLITFPLSTDELDHLTLSFQRSSNSLLFYIPHLKNFLPEST